jgi:hypothetical protein
MSAHEIWLSEPEIEAIKPAINFMEDGVWHKNDYDAMRYVPGILAEFTRALES